MAWNNYRSFGRLFDEIFEEFREMEFSLGEGPSLGLTGRDVRISGPFVYGYSVTIGPDGQPNVREYRNAMAEEGAGKTARGEVIEPYTEIVRDDKAEKVKILAELPGVEKQDVQVTAGEKSVSITAKHGTKAYQAEVEFPPDVRSETPIAKLTNGVLELEFSIKKPKKGTSIRVD